MEAIRKVETALGAFCYIINHNRLYSGKYSYCTFDEDIFNFSTHEYLREIENYRLDKKNYDVNVLENILERHSKMCGFIKKTWSETQVKKNKKAFVLQYDAIDNDYGEVHEVKWEFFLPQEYGGAAYCEGRVCISIRDIIRYTNRIMEIIKPPFYKLELDKETESKVLENFEFWESRKHSNKGYVNIFQDITKQQFLEMVHNADFSELYNKPVTCIDELRNVYKVDELDESLVRRGVQPNNAVNTFFIDTESEETVESLACLFTEDESKKRNCLKRKKCLKTKIRR